MKHPSDKDFKLFGKILFYGLILPALFYYLYQGAKFCFNALFRAHDKVPPKTNKAPPQQSKPSPEVSPSKKYSELGKNRDENTETNQENKYVYIVAKLTDSIKYPKRKFFQSPPSLTKRLENTFLGQKSTHYYLEKSCFSNLDSANERLKLLQQSDPDNAFAIIKATDNPITYRFIHPPSEKVIRVFHGIMEKVISIAFTKIEKPSANQPSTHKI
jgi:hypothetical protein